MKMIVGLGNPGRDYLNSRHNVGFLVIKNLGSIYRTRFKKEKAIPALSAAVKIKEQLILVIPLTFMNLSGLAVGLLAKKYKIDLKNLVVVCDDLDLDLGRIKIRPRGSSGGHRGLQSIIDSLGTIEFPRLRIGINRPLRNRDAVRYVLSDFNKKEKAQLEKTVSRSCDCIQTWISDGVNEAMNIFNAATSVRIL